VVTSPDSQPRPGHGSPTVASKRGSESTGSRTASAPLGHGDGDEDNDDRNHRDARSSPRKSPRSPVVSSEY